MPMSGRDALIAGRYRLVNRIGSGGMGIVWEAWDERLRRPVALKQLHPQVGLGGADAQIANDRAMREARITARLHHPHAVPVFDVVEHDGQPCLIMQYLPSMSLQTLLNDKGALSPTEVARIGAEVASALAAAHRAGIVHRDVKPGNVLIAKDGSAKISDFGISHAVGDVTLTSTGMITGTPAYLAPEVARGAESSFASDVFSLGATLYAALEGAPPFGTHQNPMALLHLVASGRVTPPSHVGPLASLLLWMLATAPKDRPPMEEVAKALAAVEADPAVTIENHPSWGVAAGATREGDITHSFTPIAIGNTASLPVVGSPTGPPLTDPGWPDDQPTPRRSRARQAVVGAALLLAVAALATYLLLGRGPVSNPTVSPSDARSSSAASSTAPSSTSPSSAAVAPPSPAPPPSSTAASTATASQTTSVAPPPTISGAPTAAQLAQAVTDYYGLLPGNTDGGWSRLTGQYQATTAKNRQTYQAFWDAVQRVAVSNTAGSAPGTVQTSITYVFKDGRVIQERTSFGLVRDGGILKIDSSMVLSSQPQ